MSWNFNNNLNIKWHYNSDNLPDENVDSLEDDELDINYDSDRFSHCFTSYSIIDYGNF